MSPRRPLPGLIGKLILRTTTSVRRFTNMSASRSRHCRAKRQLLRAQAVHNTSQDTCQFKELRIMTWIKTVRMEEDDRGKSATARPRKLNPLESATPIHPGNAGEHHG